MKGALEMKTKYLLLISAVLTVLLSCLLIINAGLVGDVDGNGRITSTDYLLVRRHLKGLYELDEEEYLNADTNNDGKVTSVDYMYIRKQLSSSEPVLAAPTCLPHSEYRDNQYTYTDVDKLSTDILNARSELEMKGYNGFSNTLLERFSSIYLLNTKAEFKGITVDCYNGNMTIDYDLDGTHFYMWSSQQAKLDWNYECYFLTYEDYLNKGNPPDQIELPIDRDNAVILDDIISDGLVYKCVKVGPAPRIPAEEYRMFVVNGDELISIIIPGTLVDKYGIEEFAKLNIIKVCEPINLRDYGW